MAMVSSGCWWLRQAPKAPPGRLAEWGVTRLAVVPFEDATGQGQGERLTNEFRLAARQAIGKERVHVRDLALAPGESVPTGWVGISQAREIGRLNGVDGLLTGRVLAYHHQRAQGRAWVSVSLRLLETTRGSIIWSRNVTGTAPVGARPTQADLDAALDAATQSATKEFADDLASPSQR